MSNQDIVSIHFSGKNQRLRDARRVFEDWKTRPDTDKPDLPMTNTNVLVTALLCLGEQGEQGANPAQAELTQVLEAISGLSEQIQAHFASIETTIQTMAVKGVITHQQAEQITQAIDQDTKVFAENMKATMKGGGKRR